MKWIVSIPIAGSCTYEVEAQSKTEAIEAAWDKINEGEEGDVEWEFHSKLAEGNVLHASQNEIEARPATGEGS